MILVVVFQPRISGEPALSLAAQIHEIVGPFSDTEEADTWIRAWQDAEAREAEASGKPRGPRFTFYITEGVKPESVILDDGLFGMIVK